MFPHVPYKMRLLRYLRLPCVRGSRLITPLHKDEQGGMGGRLVSAESLACPQGAFSLVWRL